MVTTLVLVLTSRCFIRIMSYLSSSEELGHSFDGMVFGSVLLLLFFRYSLHRSPTVVLSYLWENIEYFSVLFQTFVNIICHMIRGLKISLCVLFCFGFFCCFYDYHCGAAGQFITSLLICSGVCPVPRSICWNASSPFRIYIYIVLFSHLWKKKYTLMNTLV